MQVQAVSVADAVGDALRARLLAGHYPGGTLLRDTELAVEFGVARPTVRAAVAELVSDGLLERGRGQSARVRSFTAEDALDLYRLRRPVEAAAVEIVLREGRSTDGIAAAARDFTALPADAGWDQVADAHSAFHRAVFEAAGSPRLLRAFDALAAETRLLVAQLRPAYDRIADLAAEHEALLTALRRGDLAAALAAWSDHFDDSERFFTHFTKERAL